MKFGNECQKCGYYFRNESIWPTKCNGYSSAFRRQQIEGLFRKLDEFIQVQNRGSNGYNQGDNNYQNKNYNQNKWDQTKRNETQITQQVELKLLTNLTRRDSGIGSPYLIRSYHSPLDCYTHALLVAGAWRHYIAKELKTFCVRSIWMSIRNERYCFH